MTICLSAPSVALLLVNENGQFTPPWPTRPLAAQLMVWPDSVPAPDPVTVMLLAHVAVNVTLALVVPVGVTVYFRLPHPVAGVEAVTDCHVPAKSSADVVGVGVVGVLGFFFDKRSQPDAASAAIMSAGRRVDFMILLIVTYDAVLYDLRGRLFHYPYGIYRFGRY